MSDSTLLCSNLIFGIRRGMQAQLSVAQNDLEVLSYAVLLIHSTVRVCLQLDALPAA